MARKDDWGTKRSLGALIARLLKQESLSFGLAKQLLTLPQSDAPPRFGESLLLRDNEALSNAIQRDNFRRDEAGFTVQRRRDRSDSPLLQLAANIYATAIYVQTLLSKFQRRKSDGF